MSGPARILNPRHSSTPQATSGDELADMTTLQPGLAILARIIVRLHSRAVATETGLSQDPGEDASKDPAKCQPNGKGDRRRRIEKSNMPTSGLARGKDE